MATKTQTTTKLLSNRNRDRAAKTEPSKRSALAPARGSAKREAAKLREFRDDLEERRTPDDTTARSSLFGGRRQ